MRRFCTLSLAVMAVGFTSNAGVVLYDNLAGAPVYITTYTEKVTSAPTLPSPPPDSGPLYNSFSTPTYAPWTGGALAYSLTEVDLSIEAINPSDGATTVVGLYANSSGAPGALIATVATLDDSTIASVFTDYFLHPAPGITLLFGTTYWIGLSSVSPQDSVRWAMTYYTGFGFLNQHYEDAVVGVQPGAPLNPLFQMAVYEDVTVPEPAGCAILVFAIAALAKVKRRPACVPDRF